MTVIRWFCAETHSVRRKLPPDTWAGLPSTLTWAVTGTTLPVTITWCTPTVAPLVGALMETFTGWLADDPLPAQPATLSATAQAKSCASFMLARI